ncbi:MAG: hypothetical protein A2Z20_05770 [Bdellovibrionales bacterium RBG_16_40_8]|nr:MAG: hypothetical protein A2Z20_05770 [Bdellovibrionales bacterium RBG_16_40_8]
MREITDLLQEKNYCLEKFYRLNECGLENLSEGNYDYLNSFYASRDGLLDIIKKIDEMIERSNEIPLDVQEIDAEVKKIILSALDYKTDLVNRILEQDLKIISVIEAAKSNIIKELSQVKVTRKALGSYKSGKSRNNLDEEV